MSFYFLKQSMAFNIKQTLLLKYTITGYQMFFKWSLKSTAMNRNAVVKQTKSVKAWKETAFTVKQIQSQ